MLFQVSTIRSCNFCWCFHVRNLLLCTNCGTKTCHITKRYTVIQVLANKIAIITFSLVPVKYEINFTFAMRILHGPHNRYGISYDKYTPHNLYKTHVSLACVHLVQINISCTVHSYMIAL